jgi:hypothetical protein
MNDRYIKFILTVIALELLWLGAREGAPPVSAQAGPTRVIITGVEIDKADSFIPVGIVGAYRDVPAWAIRSLQPLTTRVAGEVAVLTRSPLKVEADRPLPVQEVDYTPRARPGE